MNDDPSLEDRITAEIISLVIEETNSRRLATEHQIPEINEQQHHNPKPSRSHKRLITTAAIAITVPIVAIAITIGGYFGVRAYTGNSSQESNPSGYVSSASSPKSLATFMEYDITGDAFKAAYRCKKDEIIDTLTYLLLNKSGGNNLDFPNPDKESVTAMLDELTDGNLGPFTPGPYKPRDPVQNPEITRAYSVDWHNGTYNLEFQLHHSNTDTSFSIETQNLDAANRFSEALTQYKCPTS